MRGARDLDPVEVRILGSLMEKQQTTPEYYPMTVNGLASACNQKTNREPVMSLNESDVAAAVQRLHDELLVWKVVGSRATHWDHNLDKRWELDPPKKAILTLLFLRGTQTPGELRGRSERMYKFETPQEVEQQLELMAAPPDPLVRELPRRPGQKETRWTHLASGMSADDEVQPSAAPASAPSEPLATRVERLEAQLAALQEAFDALKAKLGE